MLCGSVCDIVIYKPDRHVQYSVIEQVTYDHMCVNYYKSDKLLFWWFVRENVKSFYKTSKYIIRESNAKDQRINLMVFAIPIKTAGVDYL